MEYYALFDICEVNIFYKKFLIKNNYIFQDFIQLNQSLNVYKKEIRMNKF